MCVKSTRRERAARWALRLAAVSLVVCSAASGQPAIAQDSPQEPAPSSSTSFGFTVEPYNESGAQRRDALQYQMSPDETLTDRVSIVNTSDAAKDFYLYAADAINSEVGGGFALRARTDPAVDAASWITLPTDRYTVPARSAAIVPVQITVPSDAVPGDHAAAVVAEEVLPSDAGSTPGVLTVRRVGTRVYIRVTGPSTPSLQVQAISVDNSNPLAPWKSGAATVTYTVANTGNTRLRIDRIKVEVSGPLGLDGKTVVHAGDEGDSTRLPDALLPGNSAVFTERIEGVRSLGLMSATVSVDGQDPVLQTSVSTSSSTTFWQIPWVLLGVLVLVLVLASIWWWRRRRSTETSNVPEDQGVQV